MAANLIDTDVAGEADGYIVGLNYGKIDGGLSDRKHKACLHVPSANSTRNHVPQVGND